MPYGSTTLIAFESKGCNDKSKSGHLTSLNVSKAAPWNSPKDRCRFVSLSVSSHVSEVWAPIFAKCFCIQGMKGHSKHFLSTIRGLPLSDTLFCLTGQVNQQGLSVCLSVFAVDGLVDLALSQISKSPFLNWFWTLLLSIVYLFTINSFVNFSWIRVAEVGFLFLFQTP